jgi:hypothetical protein
VALTNLSGRRAFTGLASVLRCKRSSGFAVHKIGVVTEVYTERDFQKAIEIMREIG